MSTTTPRNSRLLRTARVVLATTAALCVFASVAQAEAVLDQTDFPVVGGCEGIGSGQSLGQSFTAGITGKLTQVDLSVLSTSSPSLPMAVDIETIVGGLPSDTVLASATLPAGVVTTPFTFQTVSVNPVPEVNVVSGTQYAIVIHWPTGATSSNVTICSSNGDYAAGGPSSFISGAWAALDGADYAFQTYVEANSIAPTTLVAAPANLTKHSVSATLLSNGTPVPGETITFTAGGVRLCSTTTNAKGVAKCTATGKAAISALNTHPRYIARFAGTDDFAASTSPPAPAGK